VAVLDCCFYEGVAEVDDGDDELNGWHGCLSYELFIAIYGAAQKSDFFVRFLCDVHHKLVVTIKKLQTLAGVAAF